LLAGDPPPVFDAEFNPASAADDGRLFGQAQHLLESPAHAAALQVTVGLARIKDRADIAQIAHAATIVTAGDDERVRLRSRRDGQFDNAMLFADGIHGILHQFLDQVRRLAASVHAGKTVGADGQPVVQNSFVHGDSL